MTLERRGENLISPEEERIRFLEAYKDYIGRLFQSEENLSGFSAKEKEHFLLSQREELTKKLLSKSFSLEEKVLFWKTLELFAVKHNLSPIHGAVATMLEQKDMVRIEFIGPLGVGKSTIARVLAEDLNAELFLKDPYEENPFWAKSQEDSCFMLRSQIYFLSTNISLGLGTMVRKGIGVSEMCPITDIEQWVPWYKSMGKLSEEEYKVYRQTVELFKPLILRPTLLVALLPDKVENLYFGVRERLKDQPHRESERVFTVDDLDMETRLIKELIERLPQEWQVKVLPIVIDPIETYKNPSIRYREIYKIRGELGLLKDLLNPQPKEVADRIMAVFAEKEKGQVMIVHSKSMFTGKTTVFLELEQQIERIGENKIISLQPEAALRYGEEQRTHVMTRDRRKIKGITIESNNLKDVVLYIEKENIAPNKYPFIFIDEIMLFHKTEADDAILYLEHLRMKGFNIVVDGIDYTFQEEPFTFMHELIGKSLDNLNWNQIEMRTRCKYCGRPARGTRRVKVETGEIAQYNDVTFLAGDSEYEPVCCQEHPSCLGQPEGFVRQSLSTEVA